MNLSVVLAEEIVLHLVYRANDDLFILSELYKLEEGDFLEKLAYFSPKWPLPLFAVLDGGLFIHQPLKYLLTHLAFLVEEGEKFVPRNGLFDKGLRDASLDIGRRASLQGGDELCDRLNRQLLLGVPVDQPRLLKPLVDGQEVMRREIQRMKRVL
jgi:hypothetical protein